MFSQLVSRQHWIDFPVGQCIPAPRCPTPQASTYGKPKGQSLRLHHSAPPRSIWLRLGSGHWTILLVLVALVILTVSPQGGSVGFADGGALRPSHQPAKYPCILTQREQRTRSKSQLSFHTAILPMTGDKNHQNRKLPITKNSRRLKKLGSK